jgi:hypothetical protein
MLSPGEIVPYCALASLQGALVVLPRPALSAAWSRLRSPFWALLLPGALLVGTFGVLDVPHGATGLAALAGVATPLLVGLAVMGVVRGPRVAWLAALLLLGAGAVALHSWPAQLAVTLIMALGCLTVGATLVRLTPLAWLAAGIAAMCIVDVTLLATGVGQPAAHQLDSALSHSGLPEFHRAQLGSMNRDYPDLVLAAVFGTILAGRSRQLTGGVLVAVLGALNGVFFLFADMLPATVPTGVAAAIIVLLERRDSRAPRPSTHRRGRPARPPSPRPRPAEQPAQA